MRFILPAFFLSTAILAGLGPMGLPFYLTSRLKVRPFRTFVITNAITILPMIVAVLIAYVDGRTEPPCIEDHPNVACYGVPASVGWIVVSVLAIFTAIYGLITSLVATFAAKQWDQSDRPPD